MANRTAELIHHIFATLVDRLAPLGIALLHDLMQRRDQRKVQTIEPNDRLFRIVGVVVPGELGRENQIAGFHDALLAIYGRVSAVALNHEAQRRRRVAVGARVFTGLDVLERDLDRVRREGVRAIETRIDQPHYPPLAVLQADHFTGAHQTVVNILPLPQTRLHRCHRMIRQPLHTEPPIPGKIFPRHVAVEERDAIFRCQLIHDDHLHLRSSVLHSATAQ